MEHRELEKLVDPFDYIKFDRDLANQVLEENNFDRQRKVNNKTCREYAVLMMDGEWDFTHPITMSLLAGKPYLLNGQHRLTAIMYSGQSFKQRIEFRDAKNEEELNWQYSRYDTNRSRGLQDACHAHDVYKDAIFNGRLGIERTFIAALHLIKSGFNYTGYRNNLTNQKNSDIFDLISKYMAPANEYYRIIGFSKPSYSPIAFLYGYQMVAMSILLLSGEEKDNAMGFLNDIRENDGLRKHAPTKALIDWFSRSDVMNKKDSLSFVKNHNAITRCWNNYLSGDPMIRMSGLERSLLNLSGTDFKKINKSKYGIEKKQKGA